MTLDTLIFKLENIRREAGTGNLQVLFREQWLFPFEDFDPQELIEQELETQ
jgi:hypothetical protein